jgi:hypothetical protein
MVERQVPVNLDGKTKRLLQSRSSSLSRGKKGQRHWSCFELGEDTHLIGNSSRSDGDDDDNDDYLSEQLAPRNRSEQQSTAAAAVAGAGRRARFLGFTLDRHLSDWTFLGSFLGSATEEEDDDEDDIGIPHVSRRKRFHELFPPDYDFQVWNGKVVRSYDDVLY